MRQWTEEERKRQAELIRSWEPWNKAGVKTPEGKAKSRMNALKHGAYGAEVKTIRRYLKECRKRLEMVNTLVCHAGAGGHPARRVRAAADYLLGKDWIAGPAGNDILRNNNALSRDEKNEERINKNPILKPLMAHENTKNAERINMIFPLAPPSSP